MKQISLVATGFEIVTAHTRKRVFLGEVKRVNPWTKLIDSRFHGGCADHA